MKIDLNVDVTLPISAHLTKVPSPNGEMTYTLSSVFIDNGKNIPQPLLIQFLPREITEAIVAACVNESHVVDRDMAEMEKLWANDPSTH